jgi:hypothetical protein
VGVRNNIEYKAQTKRCGRFDQERAINHSKPPIEEGKTSIRLLETAYDEVDNQRLTRLVVHKMYDLAFFRETTETQLEISCGTSE